MTEQEWLACADPKLMLQHLRSKVSDRKLRLFACSACRSHWHLFSDQLSRETVELAEKLADGQVSFHIPRFRAIEAKANAVVATPAVLAAEACAGDLAFMAAWNTCDELALATIKEFLSARRTGGAQSRETIASQGTPMAALIRDVFGNPFRPYQAPSSWPTTVVQLADAMYNGQDCRLPLSDALEECGQVELAEHFRKEEWHPKGCWAMDVVLGKS